MQAVAIPPNSRAVAEKIETPLNGTNMNALVVEARSNHAPHRRSNAIASRPVVRIETTASDTYQSHSRGSTEP